MVFVPLTKTPDLGNPIVLSTVMTSSPIRTSPIHFDCGVIANVPSNPGEGS